MTRRSNHAMTAIDSLVKSPGWMRRVYILALAAPCDVGFIRIYMASWSQNKVMSCDRLVRASKAFVTFGFFVARV